MHHSLERLLRVRARAGRGFTLIELMITVAVLGVVMIVLMTVMYAAQRSKQSTANRIDSIQAARAAVDMLARDLRSAGYGADRESAVTPQPPIAYIDSLQVLLNADFKTGSGDPKAYEPTGNPEPFQLQPGKSWAPTAKYKTGAETIRWTLDLNNDGDVDADDIADPSGTDAQRTPNPNDYILARQVYGDSTGNVSGNNGGTLERIALVRRPGSGVPAMFTVYLAGSNTPWNWSDGPVPANRLGDIQRITINAVAASPRPDSRGQYAETRLRTEVSSLRNVPNFGGDEFSISGWVYNDANKNNIRDGGESGLAGSQVRLGTSYSTVTDAIGAFLLRAPAGTYALRHVPPSGYGVFTSPDSFVVTVGPAVQRSFADTARAGGWVTASVYEDKNGNAVLDAGEPWIKSIKVTITPGIPGSNVAYTNSSGVARLFASVGGYNVAVTPPDSFVATTSNPVSGTMSNGDSASIRFGLKKTAVGTVKGKAFTDTNKNGLYDVGEPGVQNVYVSVSPDGGVTVVGYQYTDVIGDYSIIVPANNPPGTKPYYISCIPPAGFFPTTSTSLGPILISSGQTLSNNNFGFAPYQTITLTANRVLSLGSRDLIEKDWNGNQTQDARKDVDLVLGADAGSTDNISVWFNDYDNTPLFVSAPTYTRNAPASVLALAMDTLDTAAPSGRPDVVTGTRNVAAGNFFVWLDQNSSGNLGYLPTSYSPGLNYRTLDNGDVTAVQTYDCAGGSMPDIIVGTKSPTAGTGTFEIWKSNDAASPTFTRLESYPPTGSIPGNKVGEVTAMAVADFNADGKKDLVVGTRTGTYSGQLLFFRNVSKISAIFKYDAGYDITDGIVTALTVFKVDVDAKPDVVIGVQKGIGTGTVQVWQNDPLAALSLKFNLVQEFSAPGLVTALDHADVGGLPREDLVLGFRQNESSYVGGVRVYINDSTALPTSGSDPSGGTITNWVSALTVANFNYGVQPSAPLPPYNSDFAAGVKVTSTTGALIVFIR